MKLATQPVQLIRVFVSCPRDCQAERDAVERVAAEINRTQAKGYGVRLEVFSCDRDVVSHIGPPGQTAVDQQTPAYGVYLGIMSAKFGTPDPAGKFQSGTEHEFNHALAQWQQAGAPWLMFFFNATPPPAKSVEDCLELAKVLEFKARVGQGFLGEYHGPGRNEGQFEAVVERHLRMLLQNHFARRAADGSALPAALTFPEPYRQWLKKQCEDVELGLRLQHGQAMQLHHVYVPLLASGSESRLVIDRLADESLYVSGSPGAGKSTFCRWVAYLTSQGDLPPHPVPAPAELPERFPTDFAGRLPVLVRLSEFWESLPQPSRRRELSAREFEQVLEHWLAHRKSDGLTWEVLAAHLANGSALLLFDGVDEVPTERGEQCWPRELLLSGLSQSAAEWRKRGNRLLVTSRPYGLTAEQAGRLKLESAPLATLNEPLQQLLVRRWFHALGDPAVAEQMLEHIHGRRELDELVASPMLLTALCVIFGQQKKRLPEHKHELYERIIETVLANRFPESSGQARVRRRLELIAHGMHTGDGLGDSRTTPQKEITVAEINQLLQGFQDRRTYNEADYQGVEQTREDLLSNSGLLLPAENQRAKFMHYTFQDFLAAQRLLDLHGESLADVFRSRAERPEWRSTLSFLFASLLAKFSTPARALDLLRGLLEEVERALLPVPSKTHENETDNRLAPTLGLAISLGDALEILAGQKIEVPDALDLFRRICVQAIEQDVSLRERRELALLLGRLGDPRVVPDLRQPDDRTFIEIPAGTYHFGNRDDNVIAEPFRFARYPVTNDQFARFVDDGGYSKRELWTDEGWRWREEKNIREPRYWRDPQWNAPTHPVVGVSWYEADAFARWAGCSLPTERQWEAAARGPQGFEYPWGGTWEDGICNSYEAKDISGTTPIGIFARSRSKPFELDDLAGNVWELCADWYDDKQKYRVVRGGSWRLLQVDVLAALRSGDSPDDRLNVLGFRVCGLCVASRTR